MSNQPNKTNGAKPAVRKKKNLLDDRRVRLALSVLGAIVAWMVVTIIVQPGTTNTIYNVPVDYTYDSAAYTSRGLSIVSAEDKTVNLKLSGDGYTIGGLSASDFVVYPDWSSVRDSGEKTLRLLVRGANGLLNGVTVTMEGSDNTVDVVFDVVEEKTLPVTATTNYLRIADGYILYSTEVSKETVTLSGPSSELSKVATCTAEASYDSELTESVTLNTPLRFYTSGGKEVKFLVQGTLYPDVVESGGGDGAANIKSHHNVGGLPEDIKFQLIEPLRTLFKDEVRAIGTELGLPDEIVWRQPFPGPGLGIRIIGEITKERLDLLREADAIAREELSKAGLDRDIWQCPVVLLADVHSVGVQGDERTYGSPIVLRPVSSEDAMTADWSRVPYDVLATISTRITNECRQINRVVLDCTSKPPATIEWE